MYNKKRMKKISTLLILFILFFPVNYCLGQADAQPDYGSDSMINPLLEKELEGAGITRDMLTRDMYNFQDGNFRLSEKIINAVISDRILLNNPEIRESLKENINNNKTLVFPWSNTGTVRLVKEDGNILAELRQSGDESTSLGQGVSFRSSNVSIRFYLEIVQTNPNDVLKVEIRNIGGGLEPQTIVLDTYTLSDLSRKNNLTIDLSRKSKFISALNALKKNPGKYQPIVDVVFRLEGRRNKDNSTIVRLWNLSIAYSN